MEALAARWVGQGAGVWGLGLTDPALRGLDWSQRAGLSSVPAPRKGSGSRKKAAPYPAPTHVPGALG